MVNTPMQKTSRMRNTIMYSRTSFCTEVQLAMMQAGVSSAVSTTKRNDTQSMPMR